MSSNYSEEYFRQILTAEIYPNLIAGRLDLNNMTVDEAAAEEDLGWAIQVMEANGMLQRLDESSYALTESGASYFQSLLPVQASVAAEPPGPHGTEVAPHADGVAWPAPPEFEDRAEALNHLIYESFIYNKTLDLTACGPLILRDHRPEIYGKYKFSKEEIDYELESKARQGVLFFRQVEQDGLDGGQDSYRIPPRRDQINPEDYIPDDLKELYLALRDDFAASEALEQRLINAEMRSQYKAERSELFLMTELPLDTERSKKIMDKFIQVVSFAETLSEHLQKEYLNKAVRIIRECYKPDYLLTPEGRLQNEGERIRQTEELNQKYYKLQQDFLAEQERKRNEEEDSKKHSFKYKMSHTFHDLTSILSKTNKHQDEGIK